MYSTCSSKTVQIQEKYFARVYCIRMQFTNIVPGSTSLPTEGCHSDQLDHYIPI